MKKGSLLFGAIAMLMVALTAVVGTTYAWFSATKNPYVPNINVGVTGQGALSISATGNPGTFKNIVTWNEILGGVNGQGVHGDTLVNTNGYYTTVSPMVDRTVANGDILLTNNKIQFASAMRFDDAAFKTWFGTAAGTDGYYADWLAEEFEGWFDATFFGPGGIGENWDPKDPSTDQPTYDAAKLAAATAQETYDAAYDITVAAAKNGTTIAMLGSTAAKNGKDFYDYVPDMSGQGNSNYIYFPLYFQSSQPMDIRLVMPDLVEDYGNGISYFLSRFITSNTTLQKQLQYSLRAAFVCYEPGTAGTENADTIVIYEPHDGDGLATYQGDILDTKFGGHIVTGLYDNPGNAEIVKYSTAHNAAGNVLDAYNDHHGFKIGEVDGSVAVRVDIYIWIEGNDMDNTSFVSGGRFEANLQFYGIIKEEP